MFPKQEFLRYIKTCSIGKQHVYLDDEKSTREKFVYKLENLGELLSKKKPTIFEGSKYNFSINAFSFGKKTLKLVNRLPSGILLLEPLEIIDLKNQLRNIFTEVGKNNEGEEITNSLMPNTKIETLANIILEKAYAKRKTEEELKEKGLLRYNLLPLKDGKIIEMVKDGEKWKWIFRPKTKDIIFFRNVVETTLEYEESQNWRDYPEFKKYITNFFKVHNSRRLAQIILGSSLFPKWANLNLNACLLLLGDGSQGKSTFLELIEVVLGIHNTTSLSGSFQKVLSNEKEWATFRNKMLILGKDTSEDEITSTENFKNLVSKEITSIQEKHKNGSDVDDIYGNLVIATNHDIHSKDFTFGFERRIYGILLNNREKLDGSFKNKLLSSVEVRKGMLMWLLEGAVMAANLKPNELNFLKDPAYMTQRVKTHKKKAIFGFFLSRRKWIWNLYTKYQKSNKQLIDENTFIDNVYKMWEDYCVERRISDRIFNTITKDNIFQKITDLLEQDFNDQTNIKEMFKVWFEEYKPKATRENIKQLWEEYISKEKPTEYLLKLAEEYELNLKEIPQSEVNKDIDPLELAKGLFGGEK